MPGGLGRAGSLPLREMTATGAAWSGTHQLECGQIRLSSVASTSSRSQVADARRPGDPKVLAWLISAGRPGGPAGLQRGGRR
jgi:hypothetical protein